MSRNVLVAVTAATSTVITLVFQHFMVIKPLLEMVERCSQ